MKITKEYAQELIDRAYNNNLRKTDIHYIVMAINKLEWV